MNKFFRKFIKKFIKLNPDSDLKNSTIDNSLANELSLFFGKGLMGLSNNNGGFNVWKVAKT
jgi:hypothetical protein